MIFVDTNVVMYAVGRPHPRREEAQELIRSGALGTLATSAEVLQELLHAYLPVRRHKTLDAALRLTNDRMTVWPVDAETVLTARALTTKHPQLSARDLIHLATCLTHQVDELWTFDRHLADAFAPR